MPLAFRLTSIPAGPVAPRTGRLTTPHGNVATPAFMPVGTLGTVKALMPEDVRATGAEILLVNAYHLYLRPGHHLVRELGGIHRFMDWHRPILSDSGGFQVFSLAAVRTIDESGVRFRSHIDGSPHHYTPELAIEVQRDLGVDIAMPLDHVVPADAPDDAAREAAARTTRWYERCRQAAGPLPVFAIVQGGVSEALRRAHARALAALDAPGYSIGGLSVGEPKPVMWRIVETATAELPLDRPRYLMGVGSPEDIVAGAARGIDMFDCVLPTRLGRNGALFTANGRVNITNARFAHDESPVDPGCDCLACARFSAAYLHHLFRNRELLAYRLASIHNLRFLAHLTVQVREAIALGTFDAFAGTFTERYRPADERMRADQRIKWRRAARPASPPG